MQNPPEELRMRVHTLIVSPEFLLQLNTVAVEAYNDNRSPSVKHYLDAADSDVE